MSDLSRKRERQSVRRPGIDIADRWVNVGARKRRKDKNEEASLAGEAMQGRSASGSLT
jgi:hypothetical protein